MYIANPMYIYPNTSHYSNKDLNVTLSLLMLFLVAKYQKLQIKGKEACFIFMLRLDDSWNHWILIYNDIDASI